MKGLNYKLCVTPEQLKRVQDEWLKMPNEKPQTKRRKHADLIIQWANDPSLEIQTQVCGEWQTISNPSWFESVEYRIKPKTITINGIEVPKPESEAPDRNTKYYYPHLIGIVGWYRWSDHEVDIKLLKQGMVHLTEEAAIQHAKALILASGGTVDE